MNPNAVAAKSQSVAEIIDGNVIDDSGRVAVCVKGLVDGFPATMEAIYPTWPFGVVYTVETNTVDDPAKPPLVSDSTITICPRVGRGIASFFTRMFLFESSGLPIGDRRLERVLNFSYDERSIAEQFIHHPGVSELLLNLEQIAKFSELIVRFGHGIYLAQPGSFNGLELEVARKTFKTLGAQEKSWPSPFRSLLN